MTASTATPSARQQIEAGIAALESQRGLLGDAVVDMALAPLRARLEGLQAETAAVAAAQQQLKQVTVVFVDSVGSTAMSQKLEPEDIHTILDGALKRFTDCIQHHGGRVLQYTGDGLLAAFGTHDASEDDPERAIRAGLDIIAVAGRHADEVRRRHGVDGFNVRVGIDTGPVLLGGGVDADGSIRGATVNMAARMEQTAPPGGLRIHHDTYRHVRGVFRVTEEPPLLVKGSPEPVATYLVHGTKPRAFRVATRGIEGVETRMVAREAELAQLQDAFRRLHAGARFTVVTVVGDAGIGKSRLLYEFENWAEAQPDNFCLFRGRAEPRTQNQPFGLLRYVLAWRLQINDDDDADSARRKLVEGIAPLFETDGEVQAHLIGQLIGLDFSGSPHVRGIVDDARQLRNRAFHAATMVLERMARHFNAPPLLLLDDLHWADDGSLDFIDHLAQVHREQPTLVLCLTRDTLFERRPDWPRLVAEQERIDLQPLDKRASRELAGVLLQRLEPVPVALRELITGGAEGNPFYMEELLRMLIDDGAIRTGAERWELVPEKLLAAHVPPTLTGVLQARLDGLPPDEKRALQQASVVGFVFWDRALGAIDAASPAALAPLVRRGLLVPRDHASLEGQKEYAFKHLILHQVTYESLLKRSRREHHARVAEWFVQIGGDRGTEVLGLAAEHFERAGETVRALDHYTRAAEDAAARYANDAMLGFVERGLALAEPADHRMRWRLLSVRERHRLNEGNRAAHQADLDALAAIAEALDDDERRTAVALRRAATMRNAGDYVAAEAACREGLVLARRVPASPHAVELHHSLADSLIGQGRYDDARTVSEQGLLLARARGDRTAESKVINSLGLIAMEQGELIRATEYFEEGLRMVREIGNRADEGLRLSNLGSVYPRLGDYDRARQCLEQGLQLARSIGQRATEAVLLLNTASVAHLQGDEVGALAFANAAHDSAVASGQRDLEAFARLVAGHAYLGLGRHDAARQAYGASRALLESLKMRRQQVLDPVSGLARVALAEGRVSEALEHVEQLLAHVAGGGNFDGTEEPMLLPLTCWRVLSAAGDPRADAVLESAMAELIEQAGRIADGPARQGFLTRVPHHREIVQAWEARLGKAA
jgi:predicted ATPase/class 3 adenylate cyclase